MKSAQCPLCGSQASFFATAKDNQFPQNLGEYNAYRCEKCEIIFQSPFPPAAAFDSLYPENYYAHTENGKIPFLTSLLERLVKSKKRKAWTKYLFPYLSSLQNAGSILEIGCGKGLLLDAIKRCGKETSAFEPDANAKKILIKHGHQVYERLEDCASESYDLVAMFQVFEHIEQPQKLIQEIKRILRPGGIFIGETPNSASSFAKWGNAWRALEFPRHLILHSPKSIKNLLEKDGFDVKISVRQSPTDIRESLFLKLGIHKSIAKKCLRYLLWPYTALEYIFNAHSGALLVWEAKK
jgi:2-polyprenyl-3-methyl-5-hydroxy-6-metoxy-1,4-benzoquinol methylase